MATHSFSNLSRRLSEAGFKRDVVRAAIFPDWWDDSLSKDISVLPDLEIRVARFLGRSISEVRDPTCSLSVPLRPGTVLRRIRETDPTRLSPAIHTALQVAGAVARSLRNTIIGVHMPPTDATSWRTELQRNSPAVTLDRLLESLWARGVPVVPICVLPTPKFQGLACVVEERPVIVMGHRNDEPGRAAFVAAHEAGHIAAGDCSPSGLVVDEDESVDDDADIEQRADRYATRLLTGADTVPLLEASDFKQLAKTAAILEQSTGIDATTAIFAWARHFGDYSMASMAVKALYRSTGALDLLRAHFARNIDFEGASESDRSLLRLVIGDPDLVPAAD